MDRAVRLTRPGDMPTSAKRPTRSTVVFLSSAALLYGSFLWITATGIELLDAKFAYGPQTAARVMRELEPEPRLAYESFNWVDFGYVPVYSVLLITWIRFLRNRGALSHRFRPALGVLPGLCDLVENVAIALLLRASDPSTHPWLWATVVATPLKWASAALLGVGIVVGEFRWRNFMRARKRAAKQLRKSRGRVGPHRH